MPLKKDDIKDIYEYYQTNSEDERVERQQTEFIVTSSILHSLIEDHHSILEVGAGTGRYTSTFLERGCQVTAMEFVPELANQIKDNLVDKSHEKNLEVVVGDARDVSLNMKDDFDIVLIMGPLYHLVHEDERIELMKVLSSKVKAGGVVASCHLSRIGFFSYMLTKFPDWPFQAPDQVQEMMDNGFVEKHPRDGSFRGYFTTLEEIISLHQDVGLTDLQLFSQDPLIGGNDDLFNQLQPQLKESWVNILVETCTDPLALGSGRSLLAVAQKL